MNCNDWFFKCIPGINPNWSWWTNLFIYCYANSLNFWKRILHLCTRMLNCSFVGGFFFFGTKNRMCLGVFSPLLFLEKPMYSLLYFFYKDWWNSSMKTPGLVDFCLFDVSSCRKLCFSIFNLIFRTVLGTEKLSRR